MSGREGAGCDENQFGPESCSESCVPKKLGDWSWTDLNLVLGVIHLSNELRSLTVSIWHTTSLRTRYGVQNSQRHTSLCRLPLGGMATSCLDLGVSWAVEVLVVVQQPMGFNGFFSWENLDWDPETPRGQHDASTHIVYIYIYKHIEYRHTLGRLSHVLKQMDLCVLTIGFWM